MTVAGSRVGITAQEAIRICMRREHLRRTVRIALVVGVVLGITNRT
jgi:hypothetical protein